MEEDSSDCSDPVIETLRSRGWCFKDLDQLNAIVMIHSALAEDGASVADSVESELSNMDLKSFGGKSLPDSSVLRKSSHLHGPKVLQISSVRDISRSSIQDLGGNSGGRRLLKLGLTDGITEITAIEYSLVPAIPDDIVPGTKVRLEKKAAIRSGIVCLNPKVITLIGGVVPSLYEEWQMNKKYSGFSRSSLRLSKESDGTSPPPFEKLQIGVSRHPVVQQGFAGSKFNNGGPSGVKRTPEIRQIEGKGNLQWKASGVDKNKKPATLTERMEEKPSSSETMPIEVKRIPEYRQIEGKGNLQWRATGEDKNKNPDTLTERTEEQPTSSETRPKEVAESIPVQNQAASQKLLQKLNNQNQNDRHSKGRKHKGKEKQEESLTFTLDEWERRKSGAKPHLGNEHLNISHDEDLAWQLQNQFDLRDSYVQKGPYNTKAEDIRMSMFHYGRDCNRDYGTEYEGGRRGRGRGRGKGRGRWRGR